nr:GNAT family N-acetyltransferase [Tepidiforma sp.]
MSPRKKRRGPLSSSWHPAARLAALALERGCARLECSVLDWNAPAIGFYRSLGAVPMEEWTTYRLTGEALERLGRGEG